MLAEEISDKVAPYQYLKQSKTPLHLPNTTTFFNPVSLALNFAFQLTLCFLEKNLREFREATEGHPQNPLLW